MTTLVRAAEAAGVTYRIADYWVRAGYVKAKQAQTGSGFPREITSAEAAVLREMALLVRAGLKVEVAARAVRGASATGDTYIYGLPGGLSVCWPRMS